MLNNKSTPCTTTTRATSPANLLEAKENRSKFITPMWKKSSKFYFKDFRSRITNAAVVRSGLFNYCYYFLFIMFVAYFKNY